MGKTKHRIFLKALLISIMFLPDGGATLVGSSLSQRVGLADAQVPNRESDSVSTYPAAREASLADAFGRLPLRFEQYSDKAHPDLRFFARGDRYTLYLASSVSVLAINNHQASIDKYQKVKAGSIQPLDTEHAPDIIRTTLLGADPNASPEVIGLLPGKVNYLTGNDPNQWRTNLSTYSKVKFHNVYPGIDIVYYGNERRLEYDFVVAPGVCASVIRLGFDGVRNILIDDSGDLRLETASGFVCQKKPYIYQESEGGRQVIAGGYVITEGQNVAFEIGDYDKEKPLVIDPVLSYSTYLAGDPAEVAFGIAADSAGNVYITGVTASEKFPTTSGSFQPDKPDRDPTGLDAFVTKLNPSGTEIIYSTYLGGSSFCDIGFDISVDSEGNAYVTGTTESFDFPTTPGAFRTGPLGFSDAFITKLNSAGSSLIYSTYLGARDPTGAADRTEAFSIALDSSGRAYVTGTTEAANFPTTASAFQRRFGGVRDAYVTKLSANGKRLIYSTFLGGSAYEIASAIAIDSEGNAYVTGTTLSENFPITPGTFQRENRGEFDVFVTRINTDGVGLVYSTYLGSEGDDIGLGIAVDSSGSAYVTGVAGFDFPTTPDAFQTNSGFLEDCFVSRLNGDGTRLIYSTFLGGKRNERGNSIAIDSFGNAYITGRTTSLDFPITPDAIQRVKSGNALFRSVDGGVVWQSSDRGIIAGDSFTRSAVEVTAIAITPPSDLYAATDGHGIFRSTDGGESWGATDLPPFLSNHIYTAIAVAHSDPSTVYAGTTVVLKSTDGGASWRDLGSRFTGGFILSILVDRSSSKIVYAGTSARPENNESIFKTTDGGESWRGLEVGLAGDTLTSIIFDPLSPGTLYASTTRGGIFKSTDDGGSWKAANQGLVVLDVRKLVADPQSPGTFFAATFGAGLYKSTDGGDTWNLVNEEPRFLFLFNLAIDPNNPSLLYGATIEGLIISNDGGKSWELVSTGLTTTRLSSIAVNPLDSTVYAGLDSDNDDAFVAKLNPLGRELIYSTYLGGGANDSGEAIAVDDRGNAFITGFTASANFTTTPESFQPSAAASIRRRAGFVIRIGSFKTPSINRASLKGSKLVVEGEAFDEGASILLEGQLLITKNSAASPSTKLISKRAGNLISPGQMVTLKVKNSDGSESLGFTFTRSLQ